MTDTNTDMFKEMTKRRKKREERVSDDRNDWEIDLARLIHSASYRRLQAKTQVLGLGESDFYRTRLTHSMEVAQIAVGIRNHLTKYKDINLINVLPNSSLMMAIGLAHDLGHPPFGHGGEIALNYCMRESGGFEGNAQTLRIISKLEKYDKDHGINPTRRLMLGVLKYPVMYQDAVNENVYNQTDNPSKANKLSNPNWLFKSDNQEPPKCIYNEDEDVFKFILEDFSENDQNIFKELTKEEGKHNKTKYKALDTSIMELADDIAYGIHDLEDAISLHMITEKDWLKYFDQDISDTNREEKKKLINDCSNEQTFTYDFESLTKSLFGNSYERKKAIGSLVHCLISNTKIIDLNESKNINFESPLLRYNAIIEDKFEAMRKAIFDLVVKKMIKNSNVQQLEFKGQKIIVELFNVLSSDPKRFLPDFHKDEWNNATNGQKKNRVICDYIAGMTDDYAVRQYEKLLVPNRGSIFEFL